LEELELHNRFMGEALKEARMAFSKEEVPVGAVLVLNNEIVARGYNLREFSSDPTSHAEIVALRKAANKLNSWRLKDTTLYVNIEPCIMCMGTLLQARVARLVFGSHDPKGGAAGSLYSLHSDNRLNHCIEVISGIREKDSRELLQSFFQTRRKKVFAM